jgi:hypothetical protein
MPAKPPSQLTKAEVGLLAVAAIFSEVLKHVSDHPPTPAEHALFNVKVQEEIVSTFIVCSTHFC